MRTIDSLAMRARNLSLARNGLMGIALVALSFGALRAQSTPAKTGATDKSSPAVGFSIETEMLTYRALESNSEAVACDVAAYLNGVSASFGSPPAGSVCNVNAGATKATVVILPFDRSEFADFQMWRADMAAMTQLRNRAKASYMCPENDSTRSLAATAASLSPYGALAETALAMMATDESNSSVVGTIQDQAFMDDVGRELRSLRVPVLMPAAYTPYSLAPADEKSSPFMVSLDHLIDARACLSDLEVNGDPKQKDGIKEIGKEIDDFLATLTQTVPSQAKSKTAPPNPEGGNTGASQAGPAAPTQSLLAAVLSADGLARKLGVGFATGTLPDKTDTWPHILLIKTLESGGSVSKYSNILFTRIRYSGGAVGTYALFKLDGELECSGNVYDYSGSIRAKSFSARFHESTVDPKTQMVFLRGNCNPSSQAQ
jgi:hypothetical protein